MAATKGNQFWRARFNHGRKPKITTPLQLYNSAISYLEYLEANPFQEAKLVTYQGESWVDEVPKMRAPTLQGFWIWINIGKNAWYLLKDGKRKGFREVCEWIENTFYDWKFQGAAAGFLNHAIIARDLGLTDRKDITSDGEPLTSLVVSYD